MSLLNSFEKQGNFLFKYRGQFPLILFLIALPFMYYTDYTALQKNTASITLYCAYFISCVGFLIRFYTIGTTPRGTSGRNTKSQVAEELNTMGIYSLIRHPLYLGNYLIWLGISISTFNLYFVVILSLLFWIYYERIMFAEERFLERKFGEKYTLWSNSISAFFPTSLNFKKSRVPFSFVSILRREYFTIDLSDFSGRRVPSKVRRSFCPFEFLLYNNSSHKAVRMVNGYPGWYHNDAGKRSRPGHSTVPPCSLLTETSSSSNRRVVLFCFEHRKV